MRDRSQLETERRLPESMSLDAMSIEECLAVMNAQDAIAVAAVASQRGEIARAIELAVDALGNGGRLIYVGAGTSGRLGVLDASECPPTFRADPNSVQGIIAGGERAMFASQEGAEDNAEDGASVMDAREVNALDMILGIAAGGTTPFVHGALRRAKALGAKTVFLSCVQPVTDEPTVDVVIRPITGPEVLTGSTRLKAGTATKLILNQITTITMVRLGKVYENLMVDLKASNAKLWERGTRIVATLTGRDREAALELLRAADGRVKVAVVMEKKGMAAAAAGALLARSGGNLRTALKKNEEN